MEHTPERDSVFSLKTILRPDPYDKLAANDLAFIELASIRLWLRVYEFTA